ncbi:MAG: tetratricopeptide repeat protein [Candidatus Glassbacteria bacterium]
MIGEVLKKGIDYTADSPVLPQSVLDMIKGRFRELSLSVRRMLQAASVIGYEFQVAYLMALLDEREGKLYDMLDVARKENFVKEKYVHGTEYFSFNNSLIRDIIYHDMNSRKRKTYHLKIGQILESENRTDDAAGLGRLASHFESGGRQAKAFGYLIHAAQKAKELYASREAIGYLSRALELSKKCSQEEIDKTEVIECRELLGDLQFQVGSIEKARSNYSELLKNGCLEKEKVIRIQRKMGELLERECKYDKAQTFLYKALNGVSSKEDPEYMNIVIALSVVFMRRGQVDKALHYCKTLLDIPRGRENDQLSAKIDFIIGCCHLSKGNVKEALSCFRRSLKIRQKSGDLLSVGFTYLNMGIALFTMGRQKIASRYWNKAIKIGQKTSSAFLEMAARNNAAICCDRTDDPDATLSALWEAYRLARKMGNLVGVASCRNNIGALHKEMGKFDQAVIEFKKCQDIAEKMENFELIAKANINLGTVYVDVMELERAENHAWKLLELTSKHNLKVEEGLSWRLLGDVNYQRRNFSWALDCYHRARGCHEGFILDHDESKSITELKILETSCISDDTDEWYKDFEKKFSKIRGRKKEFHFQSRVSKAAVLIEKRRDTKKAVRLLREALEIIGRDSPRTLDLWRVCSMLTKAYCAVGDLNRARESSALAEEALKRIRKCNKEKKYVKAFLAREDVKEFLCLKKMLEKKH